MMSTPTLLAREGDLTIHVCCLCGGQIDGPAVVIERDGQRSYRHAGPCNAGAGAEGRDATGEAVEIGREDAL